MRDTESREDTFNVMTTTAAIIIIIIAVSITVLYKFTNDLYLDSYFALSSFFDAQNIVAASSIAQIAFGLNTSGFASIFAIVMLDNLSRILITSFILAAVMDFLTYANVEGYINEVRSKMLRNHVIICGYSSIADSLIRNLAKRKIRYVVIEPDKIRERELNDRKILNIAQDFTDGDTLRLAGIGKARAIVFTSQKDVDNVLGAIVAKKLNPKIKVMSRLKDDIVRRSVYSAGIDLAIIPEYLAGLEIGNYLHKM